MPIIERRPKKTFTRFRDHVRRLVEKTLPTPPHVRLDVTIREHTAALEFVRGDGVGTAVPLQTSLGELYFTLSQTLEAVPEATKYRLRTTEYAYRLLRTNEPTADAIIRWEYCAAAPKDGWCRHHMQLASALPLGVGYLNLNRLHTPTGWVTIEEVIRFLIHDLGVPAVSPDWPLALEESETDFYEKFTSKRYKPARGT